MKFIKFNKTFNRFCIFCLAAIFAIAYPATNYTCSAQGNNDTVLGLPAPGTLVHFSEEYTPTLITGLTINPENGLEFDFVVDTGDSGITGDELKSEIYKLTKYFLAALTIPEKELWVNLSPYEDDKIIPSNLGVTEMGRDMLSQDYLLKQVTASLMHPDKGIGEQFWKRVYEKAQKLYGTTDIPLSTFNKIWIVPKKATVYEQEGTAYVISGELKVMLEEDYMSLQKDFEKNNNSKQFDDDARKASAVTSEIVREVLLPEIEKEINYGKTFSNLRQIYNALILAEWYKEVLKESLLGQVYVDKNKTMGIDVSDREIKNKIYDQYIRSFIKGSFNLIEEDYDPVTQTTVLRKYFSGGLDLSVRRTIGLERISPQTLAQQAPDVRQTVDRQTRRSLSKPRAYHVDVSLLEIGKEFNQMQVNRAREAAYVKGATDPNYMIADQAPTRVVAEIAVQEGISNIPEIDRDLLGLAKPKIVRVETIDNQPVTIDTDALDRNQARDIMRRITPATRRQITSIEVTDITLPRSAVTIDDGTTLLVQQNVITDRIPVPENPLSMSREQITQPFMDLSKPRPLDIQTIFGKPIALPADEINAGQAQEILRQVPVEMRRDINSIEISRAELPHPAVRTDQDTTLVVSPEMLKPGAKIPSAPISMERSALSQQSLDLTRPKSIDIPVIEGRAVAIPTNDINRDQAREILNRVEPETRSRISSIEVSPVIMDQPAAVTDSGRTLVVNRSIVNQPTDIQAAVPVIDRSTLSQPFIDLARQKTVDIATIQNRPVAIPVGKISRSQAQEVLMRLEPDVRNQITSIEVSPIDSIQPALTDEGKTLIVNRPAIRNVRNIPTDLRDITPRTDISQPIMELTRSAPIEVAVIDQKPIAIRATDVSNEQINDNVLSKLEPGARDQITSIEIAPVDLPQAAAFTDDNRTLVVNRGIIEGQQQIPTQITSLARSELAPASVPLGRAKPLDIVTVDNRPIAVPSGEITQRQAEGIISRITPENRQEVRSIQIAPVNIPQVAVVTDEGRTLLVNRNIVTEPSRITMQPLRVDRSVLAQPLMEITRAKPTDIFEIEERPIAVQAGTMDFDQTRNVLRRIGPDMRREISSIEVSPIEMPHAAAITDQGRTLVINRTAITAPEQIAVEPVRLDRTLLSRPSMEFAKAKGVDITNIQGRPIAMSRGDITPTQAEAVLGRIASDIQPEITSIEIARVQMPQPLALTDGGRTLVLNRDTLADYDKINPQPLRVERATISSPSVEIAQSKEIEIPEIEGRPVAIRKGDMTTNQARDLMRQVNPEIKANVTFIEVSKVPMPTPAAVTDKGRTLVVSREALAQPQQIAEVRQMSRAELVSPVVNVLAPMKLRFEPVAGQVRAISGDISRDQAEAIISKATTAQMEKIAMVEVAPFSLPEPAAITDEGRALIVSRDASQRPNIADLIRRIPETTRAQLVSQVAPEELRKTAKSRAEFTKGGIDLDPTMLDLQIERDGNGIPLPVIKQALDSININGFIPIIEEITPLSNT